MRLSELRTGEKGVIVKVLGHGGFRKRIVEMGFIKGKTVEVILNAPLKDPIKYRLLGYEISLRRQEADMIEVVSEQEARTMQNPYHGSITEDVPVSESELVALAKGKRRTINVALVGNPNCGKTSLFNIASGAHEHVGNYSVKLQEKMIVSLPPVSASKMQKLDREKTVVNLYVQDRQSCCQDRNQRNSDGVGHFSTHTTYVS